MNYNYKHRGTPELEVTCLIPDGMDESVISEMVHIIPMIAESIAGQMAEGSDAICMMLMPDGATSIMPISEAESTFGGATCDFESEDDLLLIRTEATSVTFLGDHIYLTGPVMFYEVDEDGNECNIDAETVTMATEFFEDGVTEIVVDGNSYPAIRLM